MDQSMTTSSLTTSSKPTKEEKISFAFGYNTVWFDPKNGEAENKQYLDTYGKSLNISHFCEINEAVKFLKNANPTTRWMVITSGTLGEEFVKQIHSSENILGIVVFCKHVEYHKPWAYKYPKIWDVVSKDFIEVINLLTSVVYKYLTYIILDSSREFSEDVDKVANNYQRWLMGVSPDTQDHAVDYYTTCKNVSNKFLAVSSLCMKNENILFSKVLDELYKLKDSNGKPETADIQKEFFDQYSLTKNPFQAFIYLYTSNLVYKQLCGTYAKQKYYKVMYTTAFCRKQLIDHLAIPEHKNLMHKSGILYRGIPGKDCVATYVKGEKAYWNSFSSCTTDLDTAKKFAGEYGVIFIVKLSATNPHPNILLPTKWSKYHREKEVLFLPYFPLIVKNAGVLKDKYYWIEVEQNEEECLLSLDSSKIKKYWEPIVNEKILVVLTQLFDIIQKQFLQSVQITKFLTSDLLTQQTPLSGPEILYQMILQEFQRSQTKMQELLNGNAKFRANVQNKRQKDQVVINDKCKDLINLIFQKLTLETLIKNSKKFEALHKSMTEQAVPKSRCDNIVKKVTDGIDIDGIKQEEAKIWTIELNEILQTFKKVIKKEFIE
jgi:hypothetical protein